MTPLELVKPVAKDFIHWNTTLMLRTYVIPSYRPRTPHQNNDPTTPFCAHFFLITAISGPLCQVFTIKWTIVHRHRIYELNCTFLSWLFLEHGLPRGLLA